MTNTKQDDKLVAAGFEHPCKGSCSGWTQGYERGKASVTPPPPSAEEGAKDLAFKICRQYALSGDYIERRLLEGIIAKSLLSVYQAARAEEREFVAQQYERVNQPELAKSIRNLKGLV